MRIAQKESTGGRKESRMFYQNLPSSLGEGTEGEDGSQQKVCYRAGDSNGELDFEEWRRKR